MMKHSDLVNEIKQEFSETKEVDSKYVSVEFNSILSHDIVIKMQLEKGLLKSEMNKKPEKDKIEDNRFMSKRMRDIMFLPVKK